MTEEEAGRRSYRAFLSYSHKDAGEARWLHRRLESYRIPRRLLGGGVPRGLAPIFRDREELPAGHDLTEQVRAALAASDALVVLCSPDAAGSPWVRREIEAFRALSPDRPILAAVVAGDPPACFPGGLAVDGSEPLAADLRPEGDGRRLGLLKLVAGLSGVGLDALVQRDAQRRLRRVTAVTAAALAAMLVMAMLTVTAVSARREAERQRTEAEGLVEFMLTDLRDRLRDVGRLDAMQAVNRRALAYYGPGRDHGGLSDESQVRRARILQAIGDDDLNADDLAGAESAYSEALRVTAGQVARHPGSARFLYDHSKSLIGMGRLHVERDDWPKAQEYFSQAGALAGQLEKDEPDNAENLARVAAILIDLGRVQLSSRKDYEEAQRLDQKALGLLDRALRLSPRNEHYLVTQANAYADLADTFYRRELWSSSLENRRRQLAIATQLRRDHPKSEDSRFRLAAAMRGVAQSELRTGDPAGALARTREAMAMAEALTASDSGNRTWKKLRDKLEKDLAEMAGR